MNFRLIADKVTQATGSPIAVGMAILTVILWVLTGPLLGFSETWMLIINTLTTIVTFLMVFLIQNTQNRESRAVQIKLDELILAKGNARNEVLDAENEDEESLESRRQEYESKADE
jgi:low affinity Fe/Cu permease